MRILSKAIILLLSFQVFSCAGENNNHDNDNRGKAITPTHKVAVMYFHHSRRCKTCKTVETIAKEVVKEMKSEEIKFSTYDLNKTDSKKLADSLGIGGQTLMIAGKDKTLNITSEAFILAQTNPEDLKPFIIGKIKQVH